MEEFTDIIQIKHEILQSISKNSFEGTLNENLEKIPYEIIPGIKPHFRCCVYREREIVRQRIRLARYKLPIDSQGVKIKSDEEENQIVHVIPGACEGCPIAKYTVTSNCQNCLTKKCMKVCNFGAIINTPTGVFIDKNKCKKCGKCVTACPYNAIVDTERPCKRSCPVDAIDMDDNDLAVINTKKCINCGACMVSCPFGAIGDLSMITNVIDSIKSGKHIYAMLAPSIEGQFGDVTIGVIKSAVRALGFTDVYEVALGADIVAYKEAEELIEHYNKGEVMTTSCCPSFINLINKHFETLKHCVSTTVSPMGATARYVKSLDDDCLTVFIGPCVTKKNEALNSYKGLVDYVLTFEELYAMFKSKSIDLNSLPKTNEEATTYGKGFAKSGGVARAALEAIKEKNINADIKIKIANGIDECKKALMLLKANRLPENFIEGMGCAGGCLNGPASCSSSISSRKIFDKYLDNGNNSITKVVESKNLDSIDIHIENQV